MMNRLKKSKNGSATVEYILVFATIIGFILVAMSSTGFFTESWWYVLNSTAWGVGNMGYRINLGRGGSIAGTSEMNMGSGFYGSGHKIDGSKDWGNGPGPE